MTAPPNSSPVGGGAYTVALEERVCAEIASRSDELVGLTADLIRFDTTARGTDDKPRDEADLQELLAQRLRRAGATAQLWEPETGVVPDSRMVPGGINFDGFPQMVARFPGTGGGRSLLLNGHIDVVSPEPRERWTSGPNDPEVRDGRLYGRGACDMKGGVAAMTLAAEVLADLGVRLAGDLLLNTVTDEESTGAGGVAAVAHGVRADAAVVTEPTSLDVGVAFRGSMLAAITVPGRTGHATGLQPHWREGGAVNAIDKAAVVLDALRRLREDWRGRADHAHPLLPSGNIVPTTVAGGDWEVSYPASCRLSCHVTYLPGSADADGFGRDVGRELEDWVRTAAQSDPWLAENPPTVEWGSDVPPAEVDPQHPVVRVLQEVGQQLGRGGRVFGADFWSDAATLTLMGATPSVVLGPGSIRVAHTVDEYVPVVDLVTTAQSVALAAMRFCGTTPPAQL